MSGHSKWAQIKHKKAASDAKRGNLFSKLAKAVTAAAKTGGAEPETSPRLRFAIQKAREANMPQGNIERAIARADPSKSGAELFETLYEAYAPGGSALLIESTTDNKNRTAAEIKHIVSECGGKLAEAGSVLWMFERKGVIVLADEKNPHLGAPETELALIEAGAEELSRDTGSLALILPYDERARVADKLLATGLVIQESYDAFVPSVIKTVDPEATRAAERLIEQLEAHDDVQTVWSNLD